MSELEKKFKRSAAGSLLPTRFCCSSCVEDKERGFGDDIDNCCCRYPDCQIEELKWLERQGKQN